MMTRSKSAGVHDGEVTLGPFENLALISLERLEVTDSLASHLVRGQLFAVVVDRHLDLGLPLVTPDRRGAAAERHEGAILEVGEVEE